MPAHLDRVREGDVEPERLAVGLACERAAHPVALSFADHALVRDRRLLGIPRDVEDHEVAELPRARACSIAASTSSGETCAPAQSLNVRRTFVAGTAPISTRSLRGTSS